MYIFIDGQISSELQELGKSHCPTVDFCTMNKTVNRLVSCCRKCTCKTSCLKTKTCCPDVLDQFPEVEPVTTECINGYMQNDYYRHALNVRQKNPLAIIGYMAISHCADGQSCRDPDVKTTLTFEDFPPVYNTEHSRLYRNADCAKCNGVTEYSR
ncbi:hypothetical protein ACF0H5_013273 [Mactra antiquata]